MAASIVATFHVWSSSDYSSGIGKCRFLFAQHVAGPAWPGDAPALRELLTGKWWTNALRLGALAELRALELDLPEFGDAAV